MNYPNIEEHEVKQAENNLNNLQSTSAEKIEHRNNLDSEVRELLSNKYRTKAFLKRCDKNHLLWLKESVGEVIAMREEAEEALEKEFEKKRETFDLIASCMEEGNVTMADLNRAFPEKPKAVSKAPSVAGLVRCKCHIFDAEFLWSGIGTMPKAFLCYMAQGHDIASIVLPEDEWQTLPNRPRSNIPLKYKAEANNLVDSFKREGMKAYYSDVIKFNQKNA